MFGLGGSLMGDTARDSVASTCLLMNYTLQSSGRKYFERLLGGLPPKTKKSKLALS